MAESVSIQAERIRKIKSSLEKEKNELAQLRTESQKVKDIREKEYKALLEEEKRSKNLVNKLARNKSKYTKELAAKRKEVEQLNIEIAKILAKEVKNQKKEEIDYTLAALFQDNKGKLPWPVKGVVTEKFGVHNHPVYKNIKLPDNNGVNITSTKGAEVKSVFDGVVKQVLLMPGYNQCVLIQHGTYFTFYCKLSKVTVKSGQRVVTSQPIGSLEDGENAPILHFQIWNGTQKQDPELWLR
jgi:septal ring factor EnvC (AmiA/AmiB activator)